TYTPSMVITVHVMQGTYLGVGVVNTFPTLTTYLLPCTHASSRKIAPGIFDIHTIHGDNRSCDAGYLLGCRRR
ncbi:hypothetical protein, partial [Thalassotalea litorea]|uniref:hypothetical protein n=1 Tax=Thalassotalea litorea TaxID=2020715 RepID=UPI003736B07B